VTIVKNALNFSKRLGKTKTKITEKLENVRNTSFCPKNPVEM
jgi:ABC-type Zn2+ transport system substrate-binding protein/surface adhesin